MQSPERQPREHPELWHSPPRCSRLRSSHAVPGYHPRRWRFIPGQNFHGVPLPIPQAPPKLGPTAWFILSPRPSPRPSPTVSSELPKKLNANIWSRPMASPCSREDTAEEGRTRPPSRWLFSAVFLSGKGERKKSQIFRERRGALAFPAAPTEAGGWGGKNRAATLFSSPGGASALPAPGSPGAQRRELESFALGGTEGGASAHAHTGSRGGGGGRRAAPTWRGVGEGQVQPSPGASFVLRPHLWTRWGCGS